MRPQAFDPLCLRQPGLATTPGIWEIDVLLHTPLPDAQRQISAALGTLTPEPEGVALRCYVQNLRWFAHYLAGLDCSLTIRHPPELRTTLQALATKITWFLESGLCTCQRA